eukprot:CAMPEP_0171117258 /NCGR_PEP_ID=MMETSP0766_2-20121228/92079_1 /TAXON_ID=439317 /ORGANISM="Gambierdiscus australes, Strain CAWD 149" /LENGTH=250 /DNA_ID=CAMNT_0011579757 /DNA_START=42 /DNA_END=794 /DNA_ORIENTATION=+
MVLLPDLEVLHARILAFVTEPQASISCRTWKDHLYTSLHLPQRLRFNRWLAQQGSAVYCYNAVRPLGEDFEESVSYNFTFKPGGTYRMLWARTFDAWSSQSEQHFGHWHIFLDVVRCRTLTPQEATSDREVRYAPPGYEFQVPLSDILEANGTYFTAPLGAPAAHWEQPARTGKSSSTDQGVYSRGMWEAVDSGSFNAVPLQAPLRPNARFVEVDGELCEVSGDIVANWPEGDWVRLMRCRLRYGIGPGV